MVSQLIKKNQGEDDSVSIRNVIRHFNLPQCIIGKIGHFLHNGKVFNKANLHLNLLEGLRAFHLEMKKHATLSKSIIIIIKVVIYG